MTTPLREGFVASCEPEARWGDVTHWRRSSQIQTTASVPHATGEGQSQSTHREISPANEIRAGLSAGSMELIQRARKAGLTSPGGSIRTHCWNAPLSLAIAS
jgi:hypothetical protein